MARERFTITVFRNAEDVKAAALVSHIDQILRFIEIKRSRLEFKLKCCIIKQSQSRAQLLAQALQLYNTSHAILLLNCEELLELFESDDTEASFQRVCTPDLSGNERDVKVFHCRELSDSLILDRENEQHASTQSDKINRLKRLSKMAGDMAMRNSPPEPIMLIKQCGSDVISDDLSIVLQTLQKEYQQVKVIDISEQQASEILAGTHGSSDCVMIVDEQTSFSGYVQDESAERRAKTSSAQLQKSKTQSWYPLSAGIFHFPSNSVSRNVDISSCIQSIADILELSCGLPIDAEALMDAFHRTTASAAHLGSNLCPQSSGGSSSDEDIVTELLKQLDYFLEAANSIEMIPKTLRSPELNLQLTALRPMGVIEKILVNSAIGLLRPEVTPGQMICVGVEWTLTSELLWGGMNKTYNQMQRPRPFRNDRVWLAVDHTVDPRTNHRPKQKRLMQTSEEFRKEAKIISYLPANTSIMHTDFTREKAQPGTIVVGSDSHTCSAGSMGALAVGFGAADVVMPLVTGETWFRVPEVLRIDFTGSLPYGATGKDVILHVLGLFKRNTIAFQRAVEWGGPSLHELSMDARFAIANMTTEFGGMGTCFEADAITAKWIASRKSPRDRKGGIYFRADSGAQYAERKVIDLSEVAVTIGIYPNPDDVVAITEKEGMKLDGCFIGACTTTEEDLILGALVLEAGLRVGMQPQAKGKRRTTPGSLIIIEHLRQLGLLDVYQQAGFEIGAPGCSYCVGINDVDVAGEGEVWLSSQNRNFRNRMGKGAIGHITSAAAVAASSFQMRTTDPKPLMQLIPRERYNNLMKKWKVVQHEPPLIQQPKLRRQDISSNTRNGLHQIDRYVEESPKWSQTSQLKVISKIQRFGENVDTDAIIPAEFMPGVDNADLGSHCFEYFRPEFRNKAANGASIIIAENGFGSGSSREDAVRALLGSGIEAVIAKSFAFIYERNQLNMGLFNAIVLDDDFYREAKDGRCLEIDKERKTLKFEGSDRVYTYAHSVIEETLLNSGGILNLYDIYGREVFRKLTGSKSISKKPAETLNAFEFKATGCSGQQGVEW